MKTLPLQLATVLLLLIVSFSEAQKPGRREASPADSLKDEEQTKARLVLKRLADLLDGADVGRDGAPFSNSEDLLVYKLEEEPSELVRPSPTTQRDRKVPCKNFFWKTYTTC